MPACLYVHHLYTVLEKVRRVPKKVLETKLWSFARELGWPLSCLSSPPSPKPHPFSLCMCTEAYFCSWDRMRKKKGSEISISHCLPPTVSSELLGNLCFSDLLTLCCLWGWNGSILLCRKTYTAGLQTDSAGVSGSLLL